AVPSRPPKTRSRRDLANARSWAADFTVPALGTCGGNRAQLSSMNDGKAGRSGMHPEVKQVDIGPLCCFFTISQREPDRFRAEAMKDEQRVLEEGAAAGYAAPTLSIQTTDRVSYLEFRGGLDGIQIYLRVDRSVHPEYGLGIDHIAAVVDEMILKMVASWTQGQALPVPMPLPRNADGKVACRSRLGGMLNF